MARRATEAFLRTVLQKHKFNQQIKQTGVKPSAKTKKARTTLDQLKLQMTVAGKLRGQVQELQDEARRLGTEEAEQASNVMSVLQSSIQSGINKANEAQITSALAEMRRQQGAASVGAELANKL